jgi:uncharacterized protein YcgI (DUF1989 family)
MLHLLQHNLPHLRNTLRRLVVQLDGCVDDSTGSGVVAPQGAAVMERRSTAKIVASRKENAITLAAGEAIEDPQAKRDQRSNVKLAAPRFTIGDAMTSQKAQETKAHDLPESFYAPAEARSERLKAIIAHDKTFATLRPAVPGTSADYIFIPAMGFMRGRLLKKGQVIRIIDLEGRQVPDVLLWDAHDLTHVHNCSQTEYLNKRWNYWKLGDVIFSNNVQKMATLTADTTEGVHSVHANFCSERGNYVKFGIPGTVNCRDNLVSAMSDYGFTAKDIEYCMPVAFFMDVPHKQDGSLDKAAAVSKPGDYVDLLAEMDLIVAISNCPSIRSPVNDHNPTAMMAVIFDPDDEYRKKAAALPKPHVLSPLGKP